MNIKIKKIRQMIREALRGDSEDNSLGDPTQISYGRPYAERLDAMMNLVRLVFEVGMANDSIESINDPLVMRAIEESPDIWVIYAPPEIVEEYDYLGREGQIHYITCSANTIPVLYAYAADVPHAITNPSPLPESDFEAVTFIDDTRVSVTAMPSDKFIKSRAEFLLKFPEEIINN